MPAAASKTDLLTVTRKEFARLENIVEGIPEALALARCSDETSIKDVIGHRAHWITLFLGWYADGQAGRPVHIPAKGYKWNELNAYNAKLRDDQRGLTWDQVKRLLAQNHGQLLTLIEGLSNEQLYGGVMVGSDKWTTGRFAEAAGASHYRSAAKYVRKCLKQLQTS